MWCVRFGLVEGVKAGNFTSTPPLDASPPFPFFPYDMRGLILVCRLSKCCSYVHFLFFGSSLSTSFHSFLCCRLVRIQHSEPAPVPSPRLQESSKARPQGFGGRYLLSLKSVRLSDINLVDIQFLKRFWISLRENVITYDISLNLAVLHRTRKFRVN